VIFVRAFAWLALAAFWVPWSSAAAADLGGEIEAAENLVRSRYYEGLPYDRARELTAVGTSRLIEMLRDPAEAEHHAQIVMALGIGGEADAYEALEAFASHPPTGEVESHVYAAHASIALAMGHLAQRDDRALAFLAAAARYVDRAAPEWSYRHLSGATLAAQLRRDAITGLAISGRPEAIPLVREFETSSARRAAADGAAVDAKLVDHVRHALGLHAQVAREGPERVFAPRAGSSR
jgi:hypothetical protein